MKISYKATATLQGAAALNSRSHGRNLEVKEMAELNGYRQTEVVGLSVCLCVCVCVCVWGCVCVCVGLCVYK